jgi:pimeloyl-ACP methyl ester carboxylesterase
MARLSEAGWRETFEIVDGCKLGLSRGGDGPPLFFLADARGERDWAVALAALQPHFTVICPDHPGYGKSLTPEWLDNIHDLAFFYLDVLAALDLEDVHLIGASLGGWIAAEMAVRSTARIARLSLAAPAGLHVKGVEKPDIFLMSPEELTRHLFADQRRAEAELARAKTPEEGEAELRARFMTARLGWQPRMHDPHLAKWLHRIDRPTQLLWGLDDRILPAPYAERWQSLIPGATMTSIAECGHLPHVEQPEAFAAAILDFAREGRR